MSQICGVMSKILGSTRVKIETSVKDVKKRTEGV